MMPFIFLGPLVISFPLHFSFTYPDKGILYVGIFQFFMTKPLACDPSSLPKYPPSKELNAKVRDEEARRSV